MTSQEALAVWRQYRIIRSAKNRCALLNMIETEPTTETKFTGIVVELDYQMGGVNYATYKTEPRGYYVCVRPLSLEKGEHSVMERFTMFGGVKFFYAEAKSFGAKKLEQLAAQIATDTEAQTRIAAYVIEKGGPVPGTSADAGAVANLEASRTAGA